MLLSRWYSMANSVLFPKLSLAADGETIDTLTFKLSLRATKVPSGLSSFGDKGLTISQLFD